ncbi:TOPRIM nucleotidyl transferase/hydrolase domain-containing protein [Amycolatopsis sp. NPDC023774]|uniref:ATP-dependent nuclease n=1 Tax=Amycolatopsis sp. NPDC023774 TaxID=3155015 RepID=UPI0034117503
MAINVFQAAAVFGSIARSSPSTGWLLVSLISVSTALVVNQAVSTPGAVTATPTLTGVHELETSAQGWLEIQAKPIVDHIVDRLGDFASVAIKPEITVTTSLRDTSLHIQRASGEPVRLDRSGLGSARRISLAVWEATSDILAEQADDLDDAAEGADPARQVIVVYDEPDTHLDYHFQRDVMRLIRQQSQTPHVSVVVATHSMNLIDGVDIQDVVLLRTDDQHLTVVERLGSGKHADFDRHLGRIATAVGLRNSVLLHERCFFAVEGPTEQQVMPLLFNLSEGLSLQAAGIALWACGGNDGALSLARYLFTHGRAVLLVVDADSQVRNKMFATSRLQRNFDGDYEDVVVLLGQKQGVFELEELFDDEVWVRVANSEWPREGGWPQGHFAVHRAGKKFSGDVERMLREHSADGPSGKPEMMVKLASHLEGPDDVPQASRDVFTKLRKLAS